MHHRLGEFTHRDLTGRDQHVDSQPGTCSVRGRRGGCVAGRRAHHDSCAALHGLRDGQCHTSVFERTSRVDPLKLQVKFDPRCNRFRQPGGSDQRGIPLSQADDRGLLGDREEFSVFLNDSTPTIHRSLILAFDANEPRRLGDEGLPIDFAKRGLDIVLPRRMCLNDNRHRLPFAASLLHH